MGCPDEKRGIFMLRFDKLRRTNFEGEKPVAVVFNAYTSPIIMRRPSRKVLREMAWSAARRDAKAARIQRAIEKAKKVTPQAKPQIVIPDMSKALAKPKTVLRILGGEK